MTTPSEFSNASPRMKSAMVQDGLEHLNITMAKKVMEIKALNAWLEQMPRLLDNKQADPIDVEQVTDVVSDFRLKVDLFTEQCIINNERIKKLVDYIRSSQPETNT